VPFSPAKLVAHSDFCINSKSSINLSTTKNILAILIPSFEVLICPTFLDTLDHQDILIGVGGILKSMPFMIKGHLIFKEQVKTKF
jgi:3-dehydroquinate synthetase